LEGVIVTYFKILAQHLPEGNEDNLETSIRTVCNSAEVQIGYPRIQV